MQDMEQYKSKVKKNIENLINSNALEDAKKIIKEYKELVNNDVDIYSFEGVIAMLEDNMDKAEIILKRGNTICQDSFDILYNLGYLYESVNNNELAIEYYKKALINSNNGSEEYSAYNSLTNLGSKDTKADIIAQKYYEDAIKLDKMGNRSDAALYYGLTYRYSKDKELKNRICHLYDKNEALKNIFNVTANSKKRRFIILSSCGWNDIYQRMHHISRALVKLGNEVIYITPTIEANINSENVRLNALIEYSIKNRKIVDGVKIYSPILAMYDEKIIYNTYTYLIQRLLDMTTEANKTIIVTYMPYQIGAISSLKGSFVHIYDCVDDHSDLDYAFWGNKKDNVWEQELMDRADAITTTAISLYLQKVSIEGRKNVYLSRNAVNEGDFIFSDENIPEDLKNIPEPRIVYTGAIYDWFDKELFYEIVKSNPDKSFIVIGFGNDKILKEKCSNLYILGPKKHNELKMYLKYCQAGIIPFKDDIDLIINCDPIKQYEYIACGLPVVTTYMPESTIDKINTFLANTKESFSEAIEKSINLKIDKNAVSNFLSENSWNTRAALLCNIADDKIRESERNNLIKNIENKLIEICTIYNSPIFDTLKAMSLNLKDSMKSEEYLAKCYNKSKHNRFIERQYLIALLQNNNINTFIDVAINSKNIKNELKEELIYHKKLNNNKLVEIILYLCIGGIKKAIILINILEDENFKNLYKLYIRFLFEEEVKNKDLKIIGFRAKCSPVFKMLQKNLNEKRVIIENSNKDPFISVIIPTRNSAQVLKYALMTCIDQNYDNYEIIVSDNSSPGNNETKKLVNELNCKKIKYFRTPEEYAMKENYEFAYEQSSGEYILLMGSDDGLLLHCLEVLSEFIKKLNRPGSITWDPVAYGWPNVGINSIKNGLFIPYPSQKNNIKFSYYDESMLNAVLNFKARYSILPMFYYNSIIKRELVEEAKKTSGKIFYASADVSTGIMFAYLQKKYIHVNMPMTIGGSSQNSVGLSYVNDINKSEYDKFRCDMDQLKKYNNITSKCNLFYMPSFVTEETAVLISFIIAKSLYLKEYKNFDVDMHQYYKVCAKHLFNDNNLEKKKKYLYQSIKEYGNNEIIKWYEKNYINNKDFKGYTNYEKEPLIPSYRPNGGLVIDCSKFNVSNVFEASTLYRNIVGY